jgi:hypothetical protein
MTDDELAALERQVTRELKLITAMQDATAAKVRLVLAERGRRQPRAAVRELCPQEALG